MKITRNSGFKSCSRRSGKRGTAGCLDWLPVDREDRNCKCTQIITSSYSVIHAGFTKMGIVMLTTGKSSAPCTVFRRVVTSPKSVSPALQSPYICPGSLYRVCTSIDRTCSTHPDVNSNLNLPFKLRPALSMMSSSHKHIRLAL